MRQSVTSLRLVCDVTRTVYMGEIPKKQVVNKSKFDYG